MNRPDERSIDRQLRDLFESDPESSRRVAAAALRTPPRGGAPARWFTGALVAAVLVIAALALHERAQPTSPVPLPAADRARIVNFGSVVGVIEPTAHSYFCDSTPRPGSGSGRLIIVVGGDT